MLTKNQKEASILKWELFISLAKSHAKTSYIIVFWNACGFCRAYFLCLDCPLNEKHYFSRVCSNRDSSSHARKAVIAAEDRHFTTALIHAKIVLKYIKQAYTVD